MLNALRLTVSLYHVHCIPLHRHKSQALTVLVDFEHFASSVGCDCERGPGHNFADLPQYHQVISSPCAEGTICVQLAIALQPRSSIGSALHKQSSSTASKDPSPRIITSAKPGTRDCEATEDIWRYHKISEPQTLGNHQWILTMPFCVPTQFLITCSRTRCFKLDGGMVNEGWCDSKALEAWKSEIYKLQVLVELGWTNSQT